MGARGPKPKSDPIIWSAELAYGIGLMTSDGCLSPDGRHLTFVSKDLEQVVRVREIFKVRAKIGFSYNGTGSHVYHRIQWGDVQLYRFLCGIGLMANKSLVLGEVKVPNAHFFDFLRGAMDGDGSFYSYYDSRWKSSYMFYLALVSGSRLHLEWIQDCLVQLISVSGRITKHVQSSKPNPYYQLRFAKKESLRLLECLYPNDGVPCLSRKRLKIAKALGIVGLSLPGGE